MRREGFTTIRIPVELYRWLKAEAMRRDTTIAHVLEGLCPPGLLGLRVVRKHRGASAIKRRRKHR